MKGVASVASETDCSVSNIGVSGKGGFRFVSMVQEDHRQPIYGVQFCYWFKSGCELLATTGSNRVSVYECDGKLPNSFLAPLHLLWAATDENAAESYYSVAWGVVNVEGRKELILGVAGILGVIRIMSAIGVPRNLFRGHCGAVNELLFHPRYPHILFSASKDLAIRIWDCQNAVCLGRLGGVAGHRDEVLTLDIILPLPSEYTKGSRFGRLVSGSLDHMICVWNIDSVLAGYETSKPLEKPNLCHFPMFSTLDLHADYVDCCRYLPACGVVASRAAKENCILLWRPLGAPSPHKGDIPAEVMNQLEHRQSALWWLKFGADACGQVLAAGSQNGRISVWRCNAQSVKYSNEPEPPKPTASSNGATCNGVHRVDFEESDRKGAPVGLPDRLPNLMLRFGEELRHVRCETAIRQVAVSKNGNRIVSVSEDGRVWRWDMKQQATNAGSSSAGSRKSVPSSLTADHGQPPVKRTGRGRPSLKSSK